MTTTDPASTPTSRPASGPAHPHPVGARDGVATANLAGWTLADLICGLDSDLVRLPRVAHRSRRWEPEPLRCLAVDAALAAMSSAGTVAERTGRPARRARGLDRATGG